MPEYTYKDIIINPNNKEAKACIGKRVYYSDTPSVCLSYANNNNDDYCGILQRIELNMHRPFVSEDMHWACIIPKKEEPKPEYIPFENYGDFHQAFEQHTHYINKYGLWICEKTNNPNKNILRLVTNIWITGVTILTDKDNLVSWQELLERFTFEDGIPCGKIKEEDNNG